MGQLERYGLFVLCLVIVLILGVAIWGGDPEKDAAPATSPLAAPDSTPLDLAPPVAADPQERASSEDGFFRPVQPEVVGRLEPPSEETETEADREEAEPARTAEQDAPSAAAPPAAPEVAALGVYEVREGDTMEAIAKRVLGSVAYVDDIRRLNPSVDPKLMRIGTKLKLPMDASAAASAPEPRGWREYTVREGDNLWEIAKKLYGDGSHANRILEANGIQDPRRIKPKTVLRIPPVE